MWLEVGETDDIMVDANVSRATMWRRQCLRSQDVAGGRGDRGLCGGGSV